MPRSTIYGIRRRHGMSRLAHTDQISGVVVRYQREHPGELVHLDVKKLGRIPDGGGHRIHGRATARRGRGIGYDYLHSAVGDRSRVAFSQILPDETGETSARFLVEAAAFFAEQGVVIQRVLTDNAKACTNLVVFAETAAGLRIRLSRRLWVLQSPATTHLARRPDADGGPRQQRWWETHLGQAESWRSRQRSGPIVPWSLTSEVSRSAPAFGRRSRAHLLRQDSPPHGAFDSCVTTLS
jgi:hypothetical protein